METGQVATRGSGHAGLPDSGASDLLGQDGNIVDCRASRDASGRSRYFIRGAQTSQHPL